MVKTKIIRDLCIGCSLCTSACPSVYEMDDEDKAIVIVDEVPADMEDEVRQAADDCPTDAIEVTE